MTYNAAQSQCECPIVQIKGTNPDRCECPQGFRKDDADASKCVFIRILPKRPLHNNGDGLESVPAGVDNIKRDTKVQILSVSPLDRLLNQQNDEDQIQVAVSCYPRKDGEHPGEGWPIGPVKSYSMNFNHEQINTETCFNGKSPTPSQNCPMNDNEAQSCSKNDDFRIELFNLGA
jgi:hypothetical protein